MKKIAILLVVIAVFTASCNKSGDIPDFNDPRLSEFVKSSDFNELMTNNRLLIGPGSINPSTSFVSEIQIGGSLFPVLNIIIEVNNNISGSIVAIKTDDRGKKLKSGHKYAIVFCDTRAIDLESKTGTYKVYDLNYDSYQACEIEAIDNRITSFQSFSMPSYIADKYEFSHGTSKTHPCDSSEDGDISFGECYRCLKNAISSDGTAEFMCDALDIGFLCSGAVAAACVLISSIR